MSLYIVVANCFPLLPVNEEHYTIFANAFSNFSYASELAAAMGSFVFSFTWRYAMDLVATLQTSFIPGDSASLGERLH